MNTKIPVKGGSVKTLKYATHIKNNKYNNYVSTEWSVKRLSTRWTTGGTSSSSDKVKNFHFSIQSRPALGSTQWVPWALSPGVKRQGRDADHLPPTSAEVKTMSIYIFTLSHVFLTQYFISHFILTLPTECSFL
jgi:hypothetical protein